MGTIAGATALWDERVEVARACRVLAQRGLVEDVLGHVSLRVDENRVLLRCRGPHERGLRFTTPADVRLVDFGGAIVDEWGESDDRDGSGDAAAWSPPVEAPLHLETLRRHPSVRSVVHAHPPAVVVASIAGVPLVPMFGSYDIPAARLAAGGIPVHPRSVLIRDTATAVEMLDTMGERPACVLHGHGLVAVGASIAEAMLRAIAVDRLARIALQVTTVSGEPARAIPDDDLAALPDLGAGLNERTAWRFHLAALSADGWDLTEEEVRR